MEKIVERRDFSRHYTWCAIASNDLEFIDLGPYMQLIIISKLEGPEFPKNELKMLVSDLSP